jgi:integrase
VNAFSANTRTNTASHGSDSASQHTDPSLRTHPIINNTVIQPSFRAFSFHDLNRFTLHIHHSSRRLFGKAVGLFVKKTGQLARGRSKKSIGELAHNPLRHLQRLNAETDVRHQRRVLTPDELDHLIVAAERSERKLGRMRGRDRAMVYRMAAFTGLRAQELASLTARSFNLRANPPTVCVDACYSKHRRTDVMPLADDLVAPVRVYLAECAAEPARRNADGRLCPGKWYRKAGEILGVDLAAARKAWLEKAANAGERETRDQSDYLESEDSTGQVVDFHCLPHGFITYLVTANCPPKVAQTLARHSTISLTMDRYTHLGIADLVDGLKRLPAMPGGNGVGAKV